MKATQHKVWIELPKPKDADEAADIVTFANNMLHRLNGKEPSNLFWWDGKDRCYCYGGEDGYNSLSDNGHWFNLEYVGRPVNS